MNTELEYLYQLYKRFPLVSTDSRKVKPDSLFFALKGPNFDGNTYAKDAIKKGAAYAVVDNPEYQIDGRTILVENALHTLQQLALFHRRHLNYPVLGITGSNGKTTTKELVAAVLNGRYKAFSTRGNLNNHIGVPLSILSIPQDIEIAVIEMGANHQGEIAALCRIAEPTHGLITNIGKAHIEGFGGLEGVKKGKSELYRFLESRNGVAFLNLDERFLSTLVRGVPHVIPYKSSSELDPSIQPLETKLIADAPFLKVSFLGDDEQEVQVSTKLYGLYNLGNIMTAIAVGRYFKVPSQRIKMAIESYVPEMNRSQLIQQGSNTIILDAYNANPSSMEVAIKSLAAVKKAVTKVAILGQMLELGEEGPKAHQEIIELCKKLKIDQLILTGPLFKEAAKKFDCLYFEKVSDLKLWFNKQAFESTHILIKGSRGNQLEKVVGFE